MSQNHKGNVQPAIDNEEHEHSNGSPATKRVLAYGSDGSSKIPLKLDSQGQLYTIAAGSEVVMNSLATSVLAEGFSQIGSVTIANMVPLVASGEFIGLVTVVIDDNQGGVALTGGDYQIGSVTISNNIIVAETAPTDSSKVNPDVGVNYVDGTLTSVVKTISGATYIKTFTYTDGEIVTISPWVGI
jgi:hypothetical protein